MKARSLLLIVLALAATLTIPAVSKLPKLTANPITDLRVTRSGNDAVLTWTYSGQASFVIQRGTDAPMTTAVIVAVTRARTWTDTGAILRADPREYYNVYAVSKPIGRPNHPKTSMD